MQSLKMFAQASRQRVGPAKSKLWFSKITPQFIQYQIRQLFKALLAMTKEIYLGVPLLATRKGDFEELMNKIFARLNGWKVALLSHAGKVVLIRAVIESLLVYVMSTTMLPRRLSMQITRLIRSFFWGKTDSRRYMALVGWDKVTLPKSKGGLGIRNLECMNKALMLKVVWKLTQQSDCLWAKVLAAKCLSRGSLWMNNRQTNCSSLWHVVNKVKGSMVPHVRTLLGDLSSPVFYNLWHVFFITDKAQRFCPEEVMH
jgi:hypothetical protein